MVVGALCLGDGVLIEVSLEDTGEDSTEKRSDNIGSLVGELGFWCVGVDSGVHHFLENWLNDTDGWVEASSGNAGGGLNAGVEGNTNSEGIEWDILGSVMLDNLDNESDEEEGHHEFNEHSLSHELSAIVAAVGWAELSQVVSSGSWENTALLGTQWESHEANGASEHATEDLGNDDKDTVEYTSSARLVSVLNHHSHGDSWVEMSSTNRSEYLSHDKYCKTYASRSTRGASTPVNGCCKHCGTEELRNENPNLVLFSARDFHFLSFKVY